MRRVALAVLAMLAAAGCAAPAVEEVSQPLPHRSYTAAPGGLTPAAAAAAQAPDETVAGPLGDRGGPFPGTTAADVVAAAVDAGVLPDGAEADPASCSGYPGCRDAAEAGGVTVVVFESADDAQAWRDDTDEGAEVEDLGGRRYWAVADYRELDSAARSGWRDVLRTVVP
jgi:hypothetical protein